MSHHLDSPLARQDTRLDITDVYLFRGTAGTVFVINVNSSVAGHRYPERFHPEALYEFKVDTDGDAMEDVTFRVSFGQGERRSSGSRVASPRRLGVARADGRGGDPRAGSHRGPCHQ
jgi:Domain of unknown function (DUF4331)